MYGHHTPIPWGVGEGKYQHTFEYLLVYLFDKFISNLSSDNPAQGCSQYKTNPQTIKY